jgi:hypothetical protein
MKLKFPRRALGWTLSLALWTGWLHAAELDPAKLPPAAGQKIDYERDIKPIFERSCLRCHGPEKPKSRFRLDHREGVLKGGDNGVAVIPGDSAHSPLVHYTARLVEDMEMPPVGKGDPLTAQEVGLLRAWIDQGVPWGATNQVPKLAFSTATSLRWIGVQGNQSKFREIEGLHEGIGGGLEHFSLEEQLAPDKHFSAEGRVLFPDNDVKLKLALSKTDLGFVRGGYEQWRRYYDDTGGYSRPFTVPSFELRRDLHLDLGRAYIDFGLTLPHWPQMVLGYEYQYKQGDKSTLQWGPVIQNSLTNNIYPAFKSIDEDVHILKFDLTHEFHQWRLEEIARVEWYQSGVRRENATAVTLGPGPETAVRTDEDFGHVQGMNILRLERQLTDWWLTSGGYLYSRLEGDASFSQVTVGDLGPTSTFWSSDQITLSRESHILSFGNLFLPVEWMSASLGFQSEWTRQDSLGRVHLDQGDPELPNAFRLYPASIGSDLDQQKLGENMLLRFTGIPATTLFVEGRFDQDSIGHSESDYPDSGPSDPEITFMRDTDYFNDRRELRGGFSTSPWRWGVLSAHYKRRTSDSDYDTVKTNSFDGAMVDGYPGFIRARQIDTDEVQAKWALRPAAWFKTSLTYQLVSTEYHTHTETVPAGTVPEGLLAGNYDAHVFGINSWVSLSTRLSLSATFAYTHSRMQTADNGNPSVVPYKGDIYSVLAHAIYHVNKAVDWQVDYAFSQANYGQNNIADGLPLGLEYTRHGLMVGTTWRLSPALTSNLRYAFYEYSEPSSGNFNDYTAHGIFATLVIQWQ